MGSIAIFIGCSILLIWAFRVEIAAAVQVWTNSRTFGHAFFVFPITLFLFYRRRHRLAALQPRAAPWVLVPIFILTGFWIAGYLANVMVVKQFAFVAIWQSLFLLVMGWRATRTAIFPLAYLYLAVPFGVSIIPVLQDITAQLVVRLLRLTGMPVFLDGYQIEIPTGSFLVAEACSGVRYLTVCVALGILAADLFFRSWRRRIFFVGLSIAVPIIANGIRAYGIIMIAHLSDYTIAVDIDHVLYGFVFLSVVTLSLLGIGVLLREDHLSPRADTMHPHAPSGMAESAPTRRYKQALCAGLAMAVILLGQAWAGAATAPPAGVVATLRGPVVSSPWVSENGKEPAWTPRFEGVDGTLQQAYRREEEYVDLHVAYYAYQREGAEAVSDLNRITTGSEWKVLNSNQMTVQIADLLLPVNRLILRRNDRTILVWYWYWVGGQNTNSRLTGKLLEVTALTTGGERAAAIIAVSSQVSENVTGTAALLKNFLQQSLDSGGALFQVEPSIRAATGEPQSPPDTTGEPVKP